MTAQRLGVVVAVALSASTAARAESGEALFAPCAVCHSLEDGKNDIGPSLHGFLAKPIGGTEGFRYSNVMKAQDGMWTDALLDKFLADPQGTFRGNKMPFSGMANAADRATLIAWLKEKTK